MGTTLTSGFILPSASRPDATLGLPIDSVVCVKDLALQVGEVHRVAVGESDRSDPCRGEVQRRG